ITVAASEGRLYTICPPLKRVPAPPTGLPRGGATRRSRKGADICSFFQVKSRPSPSPFLPGGGVRRSRPAGKNGSGQGRFSGGRQLLQQGAVPTVGPGRAPGQGRATPD